MKFIDIFTNEEALKDIKQHNGLWFVNVFQEVWNPNATDVYVRTNRYAYANRKQARNAKWDDKVGQNGRAA